MDPDIQISPYNDFFYTNNISDISDKYEVCSRNAIHVTNVTNTYLNFDKVDNKTVIEQLTRDYNDRAWVQ